LVLERILKKIIDSVRDFATRGAANGGRVTRQYSVVVLATEETLRVALKVATDIDLTIDTTKLEENIFKSVKSK
jgi:hypothetical protein